jgi:hypothetical protein
MNLRQLDRILLIAGGAAAAASTLRILGSGVTLPALALLSAGALCVFIPLMRLLGGRWEEPSSRRAALAIVFCAHLVATLFFFPPGDVLNGRPVLTLDHSLHYYQAERARDVFGERMRCWAYDPYFMAGYPGGAVFDVDSKGVELWCALLRPLSTARAYKLFILLGYLLLPLSIYAGSRRLGFGFEESIFGVLLLLAWWHWGRPYAGDFRFAGMFSYLIVMHLSFYVAGSFRSFLRGEGGWPFFVAGPLAFLIHPTAAVLLPAPLVALVIARRRIDRRLVGGSVLWCLLVIAVNLLWIIQLLRYINIKVPSETFFQVAGPVEMFRLLLKWGNLPALALAVLAVAGIAAMTRDRRGAIAAAPLSGSVFLVLISTFGIYLPLLDQMEPGRFIVPAFVFMAPLAGAGFLVLLRLCGGALRNVYRPERLGVFPVYALLVCIPFLGMLSARAFYRHTVSTTFTPEVKQLLDVLINNTDTSGRLMIEDGPAWYYGDSFIVSIVPLYTGVEQIGGPYPFAFIRHNFSNFSYCRAFDSSLQEMEAAAFRQYVDMYNIHWIVTASQECRESVAEKGIGREVWTSRHFAFFEVVDPSTFTDPPGMRVEAGYGRIFVETGGTEPVPGGYAVLKYHWDRGMSVDPPARISPVQVLDDPVPFVRLEPYGAATIQITIK